MHGGSSSSYLSAGVRRVQDQHFLFSEALPSGSSSQKVVRSVFSCGGKVKGLESQRVLFPRQ